MLKGSCIHNASFMFVGKTHYEVCDVVKGTTTNYEHVVYADIPLDNEPAKTRKIAGSDKVENNLTLQGVMMVDGAPVEFYGSDTAWRKLIAMEN